MRKKYTKILLNTLLIIICVSFQRCKDQDTVTPQQEDDAIENTDVLQKIKSLGFAENQIKEMPNYYLADGDLYFPKKSALRKTITPANKSGHRITEKYATLTIYVDESLANVMDEHWRAGIDQAIAEWNTREHVHFHFALTNSTTANITVVKDIDLPKDLAIAAEFPRDGRTGSSIRLNVAATKTVDDRKQAFAHALEHCVGFLHSTSLKNKDVEITSGALRTSEDPDYRFKLYAIQGDVLYRVNKKTGGKQVVDSGWAGTEVMGEGDGLLYMVQFGTLFAVDPGTGWYDRLTNGWEGSQYMTSIPYLGKLYIMQDSWIWPVDPKTGLWDASLGSFTLARGMVGSYDYTADDWMLKLLKRKPGSKTVSLLYIINPSNGSVESKITIPASDVWGWNENFFLAALHYDYLVVFNGALTYIEGRSYEENFGVPWLNIDLVSSDNYNHCYVMADGTLYQLYVYEGPYFRHYGDLTQLGIKGNFTGTSCLVYLDDYWFWSTVFKAPR